MEYLILAQHLKRFSLLVNHEIANKTKKLTFFKRKAPKCSFGNEKSLDLFHKEQSLEVFSPHIFGFMWMHWTLFRAFFTNSSILEFWAWDGLGVFAKYSWIVSVRMQVASRRSLFDFLYFIVQIMHGFFLWMTGIWYSTIHSYTGILIQSDIQYIQKSWKTSTIKGFWLIMNHMSMSKNYTQRLCPLKPVVWGWP